MTAADRILVVDSDAVHRASLAHALRGRGHAVDDVPSLLAALLGVFARAPALILVVAERLEGDCTDFVRLVRSDPRAADVPIVALLRGGGQGEAGVDAVLNAPVPPDELTACVRALVAARQLRLHGAQLPGGVRFDVEGAALRRRDRTVFLRPREARLLEFLLLNEGDVLSRRVLIERVWDGRETHSRVVDTTVCRLRRALEDLGCHDAVRAVRGRGYRLFLRDTLAQGAPAVSSRAFDPFNGVIA